MRYRRYLVAVVLALLAGAAFLPARPAAADGAAGGISLWADGTLHLFGNFSVATDGAPYWAGGDYARSVALDAAQTGGWTLDAYGGIHAWGAAPAVAAPGYPHYWPGRDVGRAFAVLNDDSSGYVLTADGALYPFGSAPALDDGARWPGQDIARGLVIHESSGKPDGGWILRADGVISNFGAAPPINSGLVPTGGVWQALHTNGSDTYAVARFGTVANVVGSLHVDWQSYSDTGSSDLIRDTLVVGDTGTAATQPQSSAAISIFNNATNPQGGIVLDGFGGLHTYGGMWIDVRHAPYWLGWDYARAVRLAPNDIGGWTLGGWGGIHNWGAAPPIATPAFWLGWDIARDLFVLPDQQSGYLLDGYGGVHAFGPNAPPLSGFPYWAGWDAARGFDIHLDNNGVPDGGWTVDLYGGIHNWGAAPAINTAPDYWPGRDLYLKLRHSDGAAYVVNRWGGVTDVSGGDLHPNWNGYSDWGGWDILRDDVLVHAGATASGTGTQPESAAAATAFWNTAETNVIMGVPTIKQSHPLDCEAAALRAALAAKGVNVSEDWLLAQIGADTRPAVKNPFGVILQWGNPYETFVGNVNGSEPAGTGYGVYEPPVAAAARAAGRPAIGKSGWSPQDIYLAVAHGNPVIVWTDTTFQWVPMRHWTSWDGQTIPYAIGEHAVTVVGVNSWNQTILLLDVEHGAWRWFSKAQFENFFASFGNMAVVVQ